MIFKLLLLIIVFIATYIMLTTRDPDTRDADTKTIINVENFTKAETYMYMKKFFQKIQKTNTFFHYRDFETDNTVIRMNLDTLYSLAIIDTSQGDIKLNIPNINDRYMSCCVLDEYHYEVFYTTKGGKYKFPQSTKYLVCLIRIFVKDKSNEREIKHVNKLQDQFLIEADNYSTTLSLPELDITSYEQTKQLVNSLFETAPTMSSVGMFGKRGEVNELKHLMGVNMGWGGLSESQAMYVSIYPDNNDGIQEYSLSFRDVPVKAFWSIIIYDKEGFIIPGERQSLNNFTATKNTDNSYTINFSNDPTKINQLPIVSGWNYTIRMYEPREEILVGKWSFPALVKEPL